MSFSHWTPVTVAQKVALALDMHGARRVLDVGSGAGKLCLVAAATCPGLEFWGIEHNRELVDTARTLAQALRLPNSRFVLGDAVRVDWSAFHGLYSFNPFVCDWSEVGQAALQITSRLARASPGTVLATYFCCGAPIPASFDLALEQMVEGALLRVWVKGHASLCDRFHVETSHDIEILTQEEVMQALGRDLRRYA